MAYLINRNPSGRLLCLHGILSYVYFHHGENLFEINDLKFDSTKVPNIHEFSVCGIEILGMKTCRYLENPASPAGCGLVQSVLHDTQKSKSASDVFNAFDALGFTQRIGSKAKISPEGVRFTQTKIGTIEWENAALFASIGYGPFRGLLAMIPRINGQTWKRSDFNLGFSDTAEVVEWKGLDTKLSTGSKPDTVTRTRSILCSWGVHAGLFHPNIANSSDLTERNLSHVRHYEYLMAPKATNSFFTNTVTISFEDFGEVGRPLSYHQLTKAVGSLREFGQATEREATMQFDAQVKNRRYAIANLLNCAKEKSLLLDANELARILTTSELFKTGSKSEQAAVIDDLPSAFIIGVPFSLLNNRFLQPLSSVNVSILSDGAPQEVIDFCVAASSNKNLLVVK
jgi:hypothetical protein